MVCNQPLLISTLGYGRSSAILIVHSAKHTPNSKMMALKIVDNCLEKIRFADLVKDAKAADGFSPNCAN